MCFTQLILSFSIQFIVINQSKFINTDFKMSQWHFIELRLELESTSIKINEYML